MRTVIIPKELRKYDSDWFINFIVSYNNTRFIIDESEISKLISSVSANASNLKLVTFIIYNIIISDSLTPKIRLIPENGIELKNPENSNLFGIYHAHLEDAYILIWYITFNSDGYKIIFEYLKHPPQNDNYRTIISDIYKRNDDGYNFNFDEYFINLLNILNFDISEKKILNFLNYLNKFKIV